MVQEKHNGLQRGLSIWQAILGGLAILITIGTAVGGSYVRLDRVEQRVQQHVSEPGHPVTIAEIAEARERLVRIETKLDNLLERLRAKE